MKKILLANLLSIFLLTGCIQLLLVPLMVSDVENEIKILNTRQKTVESARGITFASTTEYYLPKNERDLGQTVHMTIKSVRPQSEAEKAGLKEGDKILSINGKEPDTWNNDLTIINLFFENEPIILQVKRADQEFTTKLLPL